MKTAEDLEQLKRDWIEDPSWDIESTDGFEDHRDELLQFSRDFRETQRIRREKEIAAGMSRHECSRETYLYLESLEHKIDMLEQKVDRALELASSVSDRTMGDFLVGGPR